MPRAFLMIRSEPHYRRESFEHGLRATGYQIHGSPRLTPSSEDVLVIWNRYGLAARYADEFERTGAPVIVAENGVFGRDWGGAHWYSLALRWPAAVGGHHPIGSADRWERLRVDLCGWRNDRREVIVLGQRGIGPIGRASPIGWHDRAADVLRAMTNRPVRIREHPGERECTPLEVDLHDAHCVVTWSSNAAVKALILGVPVFCGFKFWCGAGAARPFGWDIEDPYFCNRIPTLQRLAWTSFSTDEIETGKPFRDLLELRSTGSPITTDPD